MARCSLVLAWVTVVLLSAGQEPSALDYETLKAKVHLAIEAGVAHLRRTQTAEGIWETASPMNEKAVAEAALCGLAMMENRVPATDESVRKVHRLVRDMVEMDKLTGNESLCLAMLFLDRYHKERVIRRAGQVLTHQDSKLILKLVDKILAGQAADGRWYDRAAGRPATPLALLALWTARKYTTSQELAFASARCTRRFRDTQQDGGGWSEVPSILCINFAPTGTMTCAGLMALILHEAFIDQRMSVQGQGSLLNKMVEDEAHTRAKAFLKTTLERQLAGMESNSERHLPYFLYSFHSTAVLYRWRKIDGMNWYDLGARYLLGKQRADGGWLFSQQASEAVDTAYVLLFLGKANITDELYSTFDKHTLPPTRLPSKPIPKEDTAKLAKELLTKLLEAPENRHHDILLDLQDGKGSVYTDTLVSAIKQLPGDASKQLAREALVTRFQRLTIKTVIDYMSDQEREIRLAAVKAFRTKATMGDQEHLKHLIPLFKDTDSQVATAAHETYKALK